MMSRADIESLQELKDKQEPVAPIKGVYRLGDKINGITYWGQEQMVNKNITALFICPACSELWRVGITRVKNGNVKKCSCR